MAASSQPNSASQQQAQAEIARLKDELAQKATDIYHTLFETIDEGFALLELLFDQHGQVADLIYREVNPAFEQHSGLANATGKRASEVFPQTEPSWYATLSRVHQTGVAERMEGFNTDTQRWLTAHYSRVGGVGSPFIAVVFRDITQRKLHEGTAALLAQIGNDLSVLSAPDDIMQTVGERLGGFFGAAACIFADVDEAANQATIHHGWNIQGVSSLKQTFQLAEYFGEEFRRAGRAGEASIVADTGHDPRANAEAYAALGIGSFVTVPFKRNGGWVANITVTSRQARQWRADEIELLQDIANRVFPRIERARAEESLRQNEEQFRLLSIASSDSIYTMNPDWTQMRQLMGKSFLVNTDRASATWLETYIPSTEQAYVRQIIQQAIDSKSLFELEHRVIRADGNIGWTFSRAIPLLDEQGTIQEWIGAASDITVRKEAQTALYQSEARQRAILDSAKDYAIFTTDLHQRVTSWNPGAQALFGYSEAAILGQPVDWLYNPQDRKDAIPQQEAKTAIETGRFDNERWHSRQDGSLFYGSGVVTPLRDESGVVIGLLKVMRDLTQQKRAEQALQQADQRKDEFLAMLAHELRNPMSTIHNGLQVLSLTVGADAMSADTVAMMNRQTDHLVRLVDDLLDVSRISQGKIELKKQRVDLVAIISQAVESVQASYQQQGRSLHVDLPTQPIYLDGDATRLTQVVTNLLTNGARYTGERGQVWLSLTHNQKEAILQVRDNGIGLAADQLSAIFELFVQVDNSLARSKGGLGLGLTLVKRLVEMHGGQVTAQSAGLGQGSTFQVYLPSLETALKAEPKPLQGTTSQASRGSILVIDDNADAAFTLAMLLKLKGYEAHTRTNGRAGVEAAEALHPAAILLDIGMPDLDGYATCRLLREQPWGKSVPVIALTGYGQEEDRQQSREAGFDGHLVKPVDLGALTTLLTDLLEKR